MPAWLISLTNLQTLDFEGDQLTGTIPVWLNSLTNLQALNLDGNQLTGTIPASLGDLINLQYLDLGSNQLNGSIPVSLGNLINLGGLFLNNNQLNDTIPASLGNLTSLGSLILNDNQLTGNIPASLSNTKLNRLVLFDNQLSGNIPTSLSKLYFLDLNLSLNKLSGAVPAFLTNISNSFAVLVDISDNDFTFDGMEAFATKFNNNPFDNYGAQAIIFLNNASNKLSTSAGGTLTNNTYTWYKGDTLVATINADSTYKPVASGNYSVAVTNSIATKLTLYSDTFAITNSDLPLTLINFTAQPTHNGNLLQWQTATEINSAYFNIQRSLDGLGFRNIGKLAAAGNSNTVQNYNYTDALVGLNPVPSILFYRLQEADKDGAVTYSKIITIKADDVSTPALKLYPNPAHGSMTVELKAITGPVEITVTDAAGKILQIQNATAVAGQPLTINTQPLAAGVYFVQVMYNKQNIVQKFVRQ